MQTWEYLVVYCAYDGTEWRPWYAKGEIPNWQQHSIEEYSDSLGEAGWELVSVVFGHDHQRGRQQYELYFKRPKG